MQDDVEKLLDLAFKSERQGDRVDAIRLYRQVADGSSQHAKYAQNCAENLEDLGHAKPTYLIGGGSYDNLMTYHLVVEKNRVSLAPLPVAWSMMVACNCLFVAFFGGAFYLASLKDNHAWVFWFIIILAMLTCIAFDVVVYCRYSNSIRRGEILVCDQLTGKISLPDRGLKFTTEDDIHIECITARPKGSSDGDDCNSELNFVHSYDGKIERWNLLKSIATIRPFGKLVDQLKQETPIPVRRV